MEFKKEFGHSTIIGILLIIFQILLYFIDYKSYQSSIEYLGTGHFVLFPQNFSDILYLLGYSIIGIIGIFLVFFKFKKKKKQ